MQKKKWYQSKTVWTGILGALTAAGGAATGELPMANAIQIGLTSLAGPNKSCLCSLNYVAVIF